MADASKPSSNAAQIEDWNAAVGRTWTQFQEQLERQLDPLGREAIRALAPMPGEHILDVGCGCGATTLDLAVRVGRLGSVVGVDVSVPMLDVARQRSRPADAGRAEFLQLDAQHDTLGSAFDAAFSRFGVMFFSDPVAAFKNILREHPELEPLVTGPVREALQEYLTAAGVRMPCATWIISARKE